MCRRTMPGSLTWSTTYYMYNLQLPFLMDIQLHRAILINNNLCSLLRYTSIVLYDDDVAPPCLQPMMLLQPLKMIVQIWNYVNAWLVQQNPYWHARLLYGRDVSAPAFLVYIGTSFPTWRLVACQKKDDWQCVFIEEPTRAVATSMEDSKEVTFGPPALLIVRDRVLCCTKAQMQSSRDTVVERKSSFFYWITNWWKRPIYSRRDPYKYNV